MASTIEAWYAALLTGKTEGLAAVMTPDVTVSWNGQVDLLPWAGRHEGLERVQAFVVTLRRQLEVRMLDIVDRVETYEAAALTVSGRWRSPATELDLLAHQLDVVRFRDGRLCSVECYADTLCFALLIGRLRR